MSTNPLPKKSMGQHWLNDPVSLDFVAMAADLKSADNILEIGPGLGSLTRILTKSSKTVMAVEFDKELANSLRSRVGADNLKIVYQDILKFNLNTLPSGYKVVANIPYYLTSKLLRTLCESANPPSVIVLLIQKEVAERVAAGPGKASLLSISVQFYCSVELKEVVTADKFEPSPKVDSQIVKLTYTGQVDADIDRKLFFQIVKAGFSARRKTILNSLSGGLRMDKAVIESACQATGLKSTQRPQELSLDHWISLYRQLNGKIV